MNHQMELEIVKKTAFLLKEYGYTVYLGSNGRYGFFTDGQRCVSFSPSIIALDFSGNYEASHNAGSGWIIAEDVGYPSPQEAKTYIQADAPKWAIKSPIYVTPEMYLKSASWSGYAAI